MDDNTGTQPFDPRHMAHEVTTPLEWSDLVLDKAVLRDVEDIAQWVRHRDTLLKDWHLARRMGPGHAALFHGAPGTGKSLAAMLLGKAVGSPVYRVNLARVISKHIGETEKNLATLFDHAQKGNWILFFDEADADSANDRHANQQISYLLQRIEEFPIVVIVASNLAAFAGEAFARRFQSVIHFTMPDAALRLRLWKDIFGHTPLGDVDFPKLAADHELTGGAIVDVLRYACLQAVRRGEAVILIDDIEAGIARQPRASET
jgi:SpoVK/Ycf46/Vps4 family AAA+-type ATPase